MSRVSQLTNKSNQFNLTTKRYSQNEIQEIAEDKAHITLYGKLEDKFGDNGLVSVVIPTALLLFLHSPYTSHFISKVAEGVGNTSNSEF